MTKSVRLWMTTMAGLATVVLLSGAAAAHATHFSPDGKIKFVYGNLGEPVYTFVKTGIDLGISDNTTGAPISGLESVAHGEPVPPTLTVKIRYGAEGGPTKDITNDFRSQFGKAGWYTHPIIYTRPGLYSLVVSGTINGTTLNEFVLAPAHEIASPTEIMWPDEAMDDSDQDAKIQELEDKIAQLEGQEARATAPGAGPLALVGTLAVPLLVLRRRG